MSKLIKKAEEESRALQQYGDEKYLNQWGTVSPLKILAMDFGDDIASMNVQSAKTFIVNKLTELNREFSGDKGFDGLSEDYIKKMEVAMTKIRNSLDLTQYLWNAVLSGDGQAVVSEQLKTKRLKKANEESKDINTVLKEFQEKGYIKCANYDEYLFITEFLYLHDTDFKVTDIDSANDTCIVKSV
jgi:hypothetical protein